MWIETLQSGGLRMVDRVKINGKTKRISVPLEKNTPQAIRKAREALDLKSRTITQPTSEMRLNKAIEDYLDLKDCRESTRKNAKANLKHAEDILGDLSLSELTPAGLRRAFYKSNLSHSVINRTISAFKTFCSWCVDMEYLQNNPAQNIKPMKIDEAEKDPEELYLEPDRLRDLLKSLDGMPYYMTRFLALTGMRIGEASALTPEDIGDRYISITKAYSEMTNEITKPKNKSSIRNVFIQPELRTFLNEFLKWRRLDIMAYGIRPKTLFYSRSGAIYREQYFDRVINKYGAHPHLLRHTHVALLAEKGISLDAIARRIGHKGTGTTKAVYYHVTRKQKQKDEDAMAKIQIL